MANEINIFLKTEYGRSVVEKERTRHNIPFEPDSVYFDHFCSVTSEYLLVKKYFIPSQLPYQFEWEKIKEISFIPQEHDDRSLVKSKGLDSEGRWWAIDSLRTSQRELPLYNIRVDSDTEPPKCGFTVVYLDEFLKAIRPLLPFNCRLSGCRWASE